MTGIIGGIIAFIIIFLFRNTKKKGVLNEDADLSLKIADSPDFSFDTAISIDEIIPIIKKYASDNKLKIEQNSTDNIFVLSDKWDIQLVFCYVISIRNSKIGNTISVVDMNKTNKKRTASIFHNLKEKIQTQESINEFK